MGPTELRESPLKIIGSTEYIKIADLENIPAKIDTGADTSAIWASSIDMAEDGTLFFTLFSKKSPLFNGKRLSTTDYYAKMIRSSNGDSQIRYRVKLPVTIGGKSFTTTFTLANRSRNNFPVLIGRHTLENRFLVDVSKSAIEYPKRNTDHLNQELKDNPYEFHQKYLNKR